MHRSCFRCFERHRTERWRLRSARFSFCSSAVSSPSNGSTVLFWIIISWCCGRPMRRTLRSRSKWRPSATSGSVSRRTMAAQELTWSSDGSITTVKSTFRWVPFYAVSDNIWFLVVTGKSPSAISFGCAKVYMRITIANMFNLEK